MASRYGNLGTAAAVQRCFALLLADPSDSFSCAHNVAHCLLQLCRQHLAVLATGRISQAVGVATLSPEAAGNALQEDSWRTSRAVDAASLGPASTTDALQDAQAAMQVLAMLAAERPMLLAGMAKQILATAFPHRSKLKQGLELLQKWALDAVVAMAGDAITASEVCLIGLLLLTASAALQAVVCTHNPALPLHV
jgi:hypothetical protein